KRQVWFRSGRPFRGVVGCLLVVLPQAPLSVPDLKTAAVKPKRSPVVATDQAHRLSRRDRGPASIAGLPEPGAVPQLNRALAWKAPFFDPVLNELSDRHPEPSAGDAERHWGGRPSAPAGLSDVPRVPARVHPHEGRAAGASAAPGVSARGRHLRG